MVHSTTKLSPFEVIYGFNPITPLDLIPFPTSFDFIYKEGVSKSKFIKDLHEKVRNQIEAQTGNFVKYHYKGKKARSFNEGDLVWLHLRKERFLYLRKSKLSPCSDCPFQIIKKINDNAYKLDLLVDYGVQFVFNVSDLIAFVGSVDNDEHQDLRTNPFQRGADDESILGQTLGPHATQGPSPIKGPITRCMLRKIQMGFSQDGQNHHRLQILFSWANEDVKI